MAGRPKKTKVEITIAPVKLVEIPIRTTLIGILKQRMPACFDREPQGMNSNVEKLADSILELL